MLNPLKAIFGTKNNRDIKGLRPIVEQINAREPHMKGLSDEELKGQTARLKHRLEAGEDLQGLLPEAFATVREASVRVLKMRHFDVQLIGGVVLFQNRITEMKTGEGKTLTATLPLYLHGLTGKGAHLVTVNDYLAARDAEWMGELLRWLGTSVGCIVSDMEDEKRQEAYQCDITYGTNNEFAFDYLRDNMKFKLEDYVQKGHNFCIVDEVDSILIDEARTPLLISGPSEGDTGLYHVANRVIPQLQKEKHFTVDEKARSTVFTDEGVVKIQEILRIENLFNLQHAELLHHLNQALKAHHLFKQDVDYVVREGKVIIVDEFTGRLKQGSRWSDGLHQSVEAKENVEIKSENQTLASITFQNYFRLYDGLSGMTGTADTEAMEFNKIYNLDVVVVPTNLPMVRDDWPDVIYKNRTAKNRAIVTLIKELYEKGQPVLVGTISIEGSETISKALKKEGIAHEVLNAKQNEREAHIIARAGEKKAVTIATNMAGRGTDIKLTEETKELEGLFILGTERHESRRIDNQLRGRSGRQGDLGQSKFFLSLEDDLMRIFGSKRIQGFMDTLGMKEDEPIEHRMITNAIAKAQKKVEGHNFEIRKHLLEYDNVMNEQRRVIYRLRRDILGDNDNRGFINEIIEDVANKFVQNHRPERKVPIDSWNWEEINRGFQVMFNTKETVNALTCLEKYQGEIEEYVTEMAKGILKEKLSQYDDEQVESAICEILLSLFDKHWKDHLLSMDHLKEGINLRAYAQKDPLTEYKREAFALFEDMKIAVKSSVVQSIFTMRFYTVEEIEIIKRHQREALEAQMRAHQNAQRARQEGASSSSSAPTPAPTPIKRNSKKVGRNDPCPCGSGRKYKRCHGAS